MVRDDAPLTRQKEGPCTPIQQLRRESLPRPPCPPITPAAAAAPPLKPRPPAAAGPSSPPGTSCPACSSPPRPAQGRGGKWSSCRAWTRGCCWIHARLLLLDAAHAASSSSATAAAPAQPPALSLGQQHPTATTCMYFIMAACPFSSMSCITSFSSGSCGGTGGSHTSSVGSWLR